MVFTLLVLIYLVKKLFGQQLNLKQKYVLLLRKTKTISISELHGRGSQNIFLLLFFSCLIFVKKKKSLLIGPIAGRLVSWGPRYSDDPGSLEWTSKKRVHRFVYFNIFFFFKNCVNSSCWCSKLWGKIKGINTCTTELYISQWTFK